MKTENLQYLLNKYRGASALRAITVELTDRCNLKCIHCLRNKDSFELSLLDIERIAADAEKLGAFEVTITGGEPTMHPDFFDVLDVFKKRKFKITLFTNAMGLNKDTIKQLAQYEIEQIHISFYSLNSTVFDFITRVPGSFALVRRNLSLLRELKQTVILKTVVMEQNYKELPDIEKYAEQMGMDWSYNYMIFPRNNGDTDVFKYRVSTEHLKYLRDLGYKSYLTKKRNNKELYICNAGITIADIAADGSVYPCIALRMNAGNIHSDSLINIWNNSDKLNYLRNLKPKDYKCYGCEHIGYCNRCPGLSYAETGDLLGKPKEICRLTNALL